MSESYYDILGINENATKEEIRKAYRILSLQNHPDRNHNNPNAKNICQKLNEAYQVLSDEQKRAEYDMMQKNPFMKMQNPHDMGMEFQNINELFNNLFGGGGGFGMPGFPPGAKVHIFHGGAPHMHGGHFAHAMQKPPPIVKNITISMEQVLNGATIPIEIERWILEMDSKIYEKETLYVTVPKGIDDNEIIIMREKGNVINDHLKGDIKLFVKIENNSGFERKGLDLIFNKSISLKEALCGFSFELKHVNGKSYTLNNNSGNIIPPEYKKVLPKMGLTRNETTGNLIIHFHIDFPTTMELEKIEKLKSIL